MIALGNGANTTSPLATLVAEHRLIVRTLDALDAWADRLTEGDDEARGTLHKFLRFFREFADGCHHKKEEEILFETMVRYGFLREQGPIAVMLHEHDAGREFIGALSKLAEQSAPWTAEQRRDVVVSARSYSVLLRHHIQKEDRILYPMALSRLPRSCWEQVACQFDGVEAQSAEERGGQSLHALARSLAAEFAPEHPPAHRASVSTRTTALEDRS